MTSTTQKRLLRLEQALNLPPMLPKPPTSPRLAALEAELLAIAPFEGTASRLAERLGKTPNKAFATSLGRLAAGRGANSLVLEKYRKQNQTPVWKITLRKDR